MLDGFTSDSYKFPFVNHHGTEFKDFDALLAFIEDAYGDDPSQGLYLSTLTTAPLNLLYDNYTQEMLRRYLYCKEFNTSPYDGSFDNLPADWIDFVDIVKGEMALVEKEVRRRGGK